MELGSNFELSINEGIREQKDNVKKYLDNQYTIYTDSGRSAICLACSKLRKGKILLPAYICKSVVECFRNQYELCFYRLDKYLEIDKESIEEQLNESVSVVYIMHYFGKMQDAKTLEYLLERQKLYNFQIIEDTTHSFLTQKNTIGDYQICSLRKWFAIPDGGVIYSKAPLKIGKLTEQKACTAQVMEAMLLKYLYINYGTECNQMYRTIFVEQEHALDNQQKLYKMSDVSELLLKCVDVSKTIKRRKENWNYIIKTLENKEFVPLYEENADSFVPFSFPVLVEERDRFRRYLMEHNIYCAVHWPIETEEQRTMKENIELTEHILSLPLDQRYGLEHIAYMMRVVNEFR